jgi:cobalt-zinc-cadmium efflux system protein
MAHDHHDGHDHAHGHHHHGHDHGHHHGEVTLNRTFAAGIALQCAFVIGEVIVGLQSNSLAVLSDAGHNVSDVFALVLAWGASRLSHGLASRGRTYGYRSASILAALVNALSLVFVNGAVAWEAVSRLRHPEPVAPIAVIVVSLVGVAVNGFCAWLFARAQSDDLNIGAAFLHLASDAAVAAGVALTGVAIRFTQAYWLDPVASLLVAAVVMWSTASALRRSLDLAMHAVPKGIDEVEVRAWLAAQPDVVTVHDLHIWALSTRETALTAHLVMRALPTDARACQMDAHLRAKFPIHHVTIQLDPEGVKCALEEAAI